MNRPQIVTLCGSTRFKDDFRDIALRETLAGKMVLTIGCDARTDRDIFGHMDDSTLLETKAKLDVLHYHKIDLSDSIHVVNRNGYVGESAMREVIYARSRGKMVTWEWPSPFAIQGESVVDASLSAPLFTTPETRESAPVQDGERVYLAAPYLMRHVVLNYAHRLTECGHQVVSSWVDGHHEVRTDVERDATREEMASWASEDLDDIYRCTMLALFTNAPHGLTNHRGGKDAEFGVALSLGRKLVVIGGGVNVFHALPQVRHFSTWDEFLGSMGPGGG